MYSQFFHALVADNLALDAGKIHFFRNAFIADVAESDVFGIHFSGPHLRFGLQRNLPKYILIRRKSQKYFSSGRIYF